MKTVLQNTLAVVAGLVIGSLVNMLLILTGPVVIPPPSGVDVTNAASIGASIHLFAPKHFIVPFLAHAFGTLCGALLTFVVATSYRSLCTFVIGLIFLAGGVSMTLLISGPVWFAVLDLVFAYLPMSWASVKLGQRIVGANATSKNH